MGLLNSGLLWFGLGGLIPILIHLLHRQRFRRVRWAAMEFLLAALRKTRRRLQLENLILLLVRIAVMVLLALAIARPFFHAAPLEALGDSDTHHIFVVDTSYSMGYKRGQQSSLDEARTLAAALLSELRSSEQDRFSLVTLSAWPETVLKARNRKEQITAALGELKPSHYGTSVAQTLLEVHALLEDRQIPNRDRRIYLFTDLQRVGWEFRDEAEARKFAELLKQLSQRENTRFTLIAVGAPDPLNHAVVELRTDRAVVTTKRTTRFHAGVHNFSSTPLPALGVSLYVDDHLFETKQTVLPPNTTVPVPFEYNFAESGPHHVRVSIDADYLDLDDHRWLALDVHTAIRGLVVDGEPKESARQSETYALTVALDPTGQGLLFSVDPKVVELFSAEGLDAYDFLVLANVQSLTSDKVERIEQFVRRGGGLLITLGARVDKISFNRDLWSEGRGLSPAELDEVAGTAPEGGLDKGVERHITRFSDTHPMFRTFREKLRAAIYGFTFYKYYRIRGFNSDGVLARFDDDAESPAFLEKALGEGRVILFTSTIDDEWNHGVPGHPPFLPLMHNLCEYLATRPPTRRNLFVGDLLLADLPVEQYHREFSLETPLEGTVTLSPTQPDPTQKFFRLFYPAAAKTGPRPGEKQVLLNEGLRHAGRYRLTRPAPREEDRKVGYFAVNVPPRSLAPDEVHAAEGNLERISKEEIQQRYPDFKVEFRGDKKRGEKEVEANPTSNLWKDLLYALLGFLAIESVLAWLFGRAKQ
jgi:hypothetical protein